MFILDSYTERRSSSPTSHDLINKSSCKIYPVSFIWLHGALELPARGELWARGCGQVINYQFLVLTHQQGSSNKHNETIHRCKAITDSLHGGVDADRNMLHEMVNKLIIRPQ